MLQPIAIVFLCLAGLGCLLHGFAAVRLWRFLGQTSPPLQDHPPLTFWRAVKPGLPNLEMTLGGLAAAAHPEDQLLIGIDRNSPDRSVCLRWQSRHPDRDIHIIECEMDRAKNPKISKYCQMRPSARHGRWLLTDSEAILTRAAADAIRAQWMHSGADAITAGYRFTEMRGASQWLDTLPAPLTMWPGLMLVPRMTFTLGACTALAEADLDCIGGWSVLGDELAEDHELGRHLTGKGKTIALSHTVLDLESDPSTFTDYLRHQHRMAVTYRAANPWGAAGLPIFHVLPLAILATALHPSGWPVALACAIARIVIAFYETRLLQMHRGPGVLLIPVALLFEGLFWLLAWLPLPVWWAKRWRPIRYGGKLR